MKEVEVIPVVVGALGTVAKGFKSWIEITTDSGRTTETLFAWNC